MRNVFFYIFFILVSVSFVAQAADHKETVYERVMRTGKIKCGYVPWPVWFELNPNTKEVTGISKEASDAVFRILNLKPEYVEVVGSAKVQDLENEKVDAMCGDGPWILSTIAHIRFTDPFFYAPVHLYVRAKETRFQKRQDFNQKGIRFVGIDADLSTELVQMNFPAATLQSLPAITDAGQMLMDVATGKADAVLVDPATAKAFMEHNPGKIRLFDEKPFAVYGAGMSVKPGETELLATLNNAVEAVQNTGAIGPILEKYDQTKTVFEATPRYQTR